MAPWAPRGQRDIFSISGQCQSLQSSSAGPRSERSRQPRRGREREARPAPPRRGGVSAWPRLALGRTRRSRPPAEGKPRRQRRPGLGVSPRAHGMLGRGPGGGHFVGSAPLWKRLFGLRVGRGGLATEGLVCFSSVGARAGGSSRPKEAP